MQFVWGARVSTMPEPVQGLHLLQDENFNDAVGSVVNAFVKFCTPWSSKCMDVEPIWAKLAKEFRYEDDLILASVDCSMSKTTCNENEVRGYPSLLWIKDGMLVSWKNIFYITNLQDEKLIFMSVAKLSHINFLPTSDGKIPKHSTGLRQPEKIHPNENWEN